MKEKVRCQPNIVTYNILLRAYAEACQVDKFNALFKDVETNEIGTNVYTFFSMKNTTGLYYVPDHSLYSTPKKRLHSSVTI